MSKHKLILLIGVFLLIVLHIGLSHTYEGVLVSFFGLVLIVIVVDSSVKKRVMVKRKRQPRGPKMTPPQSNDQFVNTSQPVVGENEFQSDQ